jgi:hypothetical protein
MLFARLIASFRAHLAKSRRYRRLRTEIESMSERDLADVFGDRSQMLAGVHDHFYGRSTALAPLPGL